MAKLDNIVNVKKASNKNKTNLDSNDESNAALG